MACTTAVQSYHTFTLPSILHQAHVARQQGPDSRVRALDPLGTCFPLSGSIGNDMRRAGSLLHGQQPQRVQQHCTQVRISPPRPEFLTEPRACPHRVHGVVVEHLQPRARGLDQELAW